MAIDGSSNAVTSDSYCDGFSVDTSSRSRSEPRINLRSSDGPPVQRHALTAGRFAEDREDLRESCSLSEHCLQALEDNTNGSRVEPSKRLQEAR